MAKKRIKIPGLNRGLMWGLGVATAGILTIVTVTEVKDKFNGCCFPSCDSVSQTKCEVGGGSWTEVNCKSCDLCDNGCCLVGEETSYEKKAVCDDKGGSWSKGRCQKGFSVHLEGNMTGKLSLAEIIGGDTGKGYESVFGKYVPELQVKKTLDGYTCENKIKSKWKMIIKTTITTVGDVKKEPSESENTVYLDFTDKNTIDLTDILPSANSMYEIFGLVPVNKMKYAQKLGSLPELRAEGNISKGSDKCGNLFPF